MPIHVGGGEEHKLDPLGYVVKDNWFYRINIGAMLSADKIFSNLFVKMVEDRYTISKLRRPVIDAFDPENKDMWVHRAKVSSSFRNAYLKNLDDPNINNQLLVQCLPLAGSKAYLPGSSIKGAMRTAVLDRIACKKKYKNVLADTEKKLQWSGQNKKSEQIEMTILEYNKVHEDPFKGIKLSDAILPPDSTMIVKVLNCSKAALQKNKTGDGIEMFVEAVIKNTEFEFRLISDDTFIKQVIPQSNVNIDAHILLEQCSKYYTYALSNEEVNFYPIGSIASDTIQDLLYEVLEDDDEKKRGISTLRVGRFSHLESMTYDHRPKEDGDDVKQFLCQPKGKNGKWGNTRNLVEGKIPMGGIVLYYPE